MNYKEKIIALLDNKELSQEQKVKLEEIFPELKEREDEKIRKEFCNDIWTFIPYEKAHKYIAWLEKQVSPQMVADAYLRGCIDTDKKWLDW